MTKTLLVAGGGIAGMATGFAAARAGWQATVFERAAEFSEVGAGVQLGPNVTRILQAWGLADALKQVAAFPAGLHARSMSTGEVLATLPIKDAVQLYGAPYVTIHRADLHGLLLKAAEREGVQVHSDAVVQRVDQTPDAVTLEVLQRGLLQQHKAAIAVAGDGVWSPLRQQLLGDGLPEFTGHIAYRALVAQADLPAHLRSQDVSVWMGSQAHVVSYPVRGGEYLNVVCLAEGQLLDDDANNLEALQTWNAQKSESQTLAELHHALRGACTALTDLMNACSDWRLWPLCGRPAMQGTQEHVVGRVALLGDAAHPMLPYLAQGAGMAIEDAAELAMQLNHATTEDVPERLLQFAQVRWQRNARVQARAVRNGQIFHATGPMRVARDMSLRLMGARLMDVPWLYGYGRS
ncbi:MAG: FAD-dependent oxidoreductase [Burkholderiales bacterium 35-55-47]|jgi:salicylate hydroxylase|uniref:FAD-dependent monooxygenase n=1 Tax=Limnohabitans sp. TaxID=1907725 RepID=UPI000BD17D5B|nr:FAD-dependent monooxygenase [Limnohabitans sp.]OYY19221.1 MAG: FAD-dependent oxidoreductase [Burkholderiales bacterium 35-55-47]OYZ73230.1 MAG: FAD-dependent oxidoreductase [Burkholderiales bacterium 24-55-52]OZB00253.1 MAG: FAD-dependent oxidoreductase [Burkholderiales bacterium 39-55-53]HQR87543.1 FAD-dependent monooxygenase [Limnohabitans sp.]HQS27558.1 FAD-dependent monooxygenase [Limnohabitans sp.]